LLATIAVFEDTLAAVVNHQSAGNPEGGAQPTFASFNSLQLAGLVNAGADAPNLLIGFNNLITGNTGLTQSEYFGGPVHNIAWSYVNANEVDGVVVGGFGVPSRAFVWTEAGGLVDYGIQDPNVPDQQARWTAITDSGKIMGFWNEHVSNIHATIGTVGTPAVLGLGGQSDEQRTNAVGMSPSGVAVGLGSFDMSILVPVVFADDGSFTAIEGATLDQDNGSAIAINDAGVIVGTAGIGTANGPVPGFKAWVHRDGTTYDLFEVVDDTTGFTRFSNAVAINASGVIVGTGRDAGDNVASFLLTPIADDAVFANGFDP